MNRNEIIRYLENVVELEKQCYIQKKTLQGLDEKIKRLGIKRNLQKPGSCYDSKKAENGCGLGMLIGVIAGVVYWFGTCRSGFLRGLGRGLLILVASTILGTIIGWIIELIRSSKEKKKMQEQYEIDLEKDKLRIEIESARRAELLKDRKRLYEGYNRTKSVLQQYYDAGVLYGKYRNFVAAASFLDYFRSGRCSTLGENRGGDGAYNTFEAELLQHRIINKLDRIIESLESIQDNQWTIYNAIQNGNEKTNSLLQSTERLASSNERIEHNTAIAAYESAQARSELNQLKWLEVYKLKN